MEPRVNYFTVGLFVLILGAVAIFGVIWFSASKHKALNTYVVYINESVSGLNTQAAVKFNGVNVGFVDSIKINPADPQQVQLLLKIEQDTPINQSTRAFLMTQGITGVMFVGLKAGAAQAPALEIKKGENYPEILSSPSVLVQLDSTLRELSSDMHKIGQGLHELLNDSNQKAIHASLKNMAKITDTLAERSEEMGDTVKNFNISLQNFSQQLLPSMINTMNRLDGVLNHAEPFMNTLQDNPSVLLRGKAEGILGPGE